MPSFSDILDNSGGSAAVELTGDWAQGRAIFGGLVAALAVRSLRRELGTDAPLRSLLVQFAGPVEPGACRIAAKVTRAGRSASHGSVSFAPDPAPDDVRCVVLASFGHARPSAVRVAPPERPAAPEPDRATELPYLEGITPVFTQHLAYRWGVGDMPFSGSETAELGGYCRFRTPERARVEEIAVALADAWPPPILPMLKGPAPASSMTWALDLLHLPDHGATSAGADAWWFLRSRATEAGDGYAHVEHTLWDPQGHAIAFGTQHVAVFDRRAS